MSESKPMLKAYSIYEITEQTWDWEKVKKEENDAGGLGAAVGPQWGPGAKPLVGVWGQRSQKLKFFSVCHHKKTAFWSMKIRYLQVSKLYV